MADPLDDTSADHEQFEQAQLAQDRDAAGVDTADVDDVMAQSLVNEVVDVESSWTESSSNTAPKDEYEEGHQYRPN